MPSVVQQLAERGLAHPPQFVPHNTHYETIMGSIAYGVNTDTSDFDTVGWCIPPKELVFPYLAGEIGGFGTQKKRFNVYQQHHVMDPDVLGGKGRSYDLNIYNVVDYFHLAMTGSPDKVDSLFTSDDCVLHITKLGTMVRERRHIFLSKKMWHTYKGYAYSQLHEMSGKKPEPGSKRDGYRKEFGYDVKYAYHVIRLLNQIEQLLLTGDMDLRLNNEQLKAIRRGDVPEEDLRRMAADKERYLEKVYEDSIALRHTPDEPAIRQLLIDVLEEHYGTIPVVNPDRFAVAFRQIKEIVDKMAA